MNPGENQTESDKTRKEAEKAYREQQWIVLETLE